MVRSTNEKRKTPSKQLRDAMSECTTAFNTIHEQLAWFISKTPPSVERDGLVALLAPLEALLERTGPAPIAPPISALAPEGEKQPSGAG